jgi:hypothetical protein
MSAEITNEDGIHFEFNFHDQPKGASVNIKNNSSVTDETRFREIGPKIIEILPLSLFNFVVPYSQRLLRCPIRFP